MLPDHPLLRPQPLYSARGGTILDPRTLVLSFGVKTARRVSNPKLNAFLGYVPEDDDPLVQDDSLITRLHETIHWRQLLGTTLGAFLFWVRHAREREIFDKLHKLPAARRSELFKERLAGRPLLKLNDLGLPEPAIELKDLSTDPVELLRCVLFDSFILERTFYDPTPIQGFHAAPAEVLASVIADAAARLADRHPSWQHHSYECVQSAFQLPVQEVLRHQVIDLHAFEVNGGRCELTTRDILEAGSVANELLLKTLTTESRYSCAIDNTRSVWSLSKEVDHTQFEADAEYFLSSAHGAAIRHFFLQSGLNPKYPHAWASLMVVVDFALNPPLPPFVEPGDERPTWEDLYPPKRFTRAAHALPRVGRMSKPAGPGVISRYLDELAGATGLSSPTQLSHPLAGTDLPDFAAIVREGCERGLYAPEYELSYYDFVLWCQVELWRQRERDLRPLVAPAYLIRQLFEDDDMESLVQLSAGLAFNPPILVGHDGHLEHAAGSSEAFGTWLMLSVLVWGLTHDLAFGVGSPDDMGFPKELLDHPDVWPLVRRSVADIISEDPWAKSKPLPSAPSGAEAPLPKVGKRRGTTAIVFGRPSRLIAPSI